MADDVKARCAQVNRLPMAKSYGRIASAVLLCLALVLGGGSLRFPLTRLIVEAAGAAIFLWYAWRGWRAPVDPWSGAAMLLVLLMMLLPLSQVIPLPPSIWMALPGREDAAQITRAAGLAPLWMTISLQPDATRLAGAYLIPPTVVLIATFHAPVEQRLRFGWAIVATSVVGALLGLLQAGGSEKFYLYDTGRFTAATGFFANKNHYADMLLIGIVLAPALMAAARHFGLWAPSRLVVAGIIAILTVALPAANSRMGLALLPLALFPAILLLLPSRRFRQVRPRHVLIAALGLIGLAAIASGSGVVARLVNRFGGDPDARFKFWPDVIKSIDHYQPVGSGLGSFIKIFQRHESMSTLDVTYVFHAHNDVMELALEAGWFGIALIILAVMLWLVGAFRVLRRQAWGPFTPVHVACACGILIIVIHSMVDYPLRTLTLACVVAYLSGCLAPAASGADRTSQAI